MNMRVGHGYDVHRFGDPSHDAHITLGTLTIAHDRPLLAHSDGDVLVHALCDALLGACALGDIGQHFPDSDPRYAGAAGRDLLTEVLDKVAQAGFRLVNADLTLIAEQPKLAPHREAMRDALAAIMACPLNAVSIKATTTEGMGFTGRQEGIACHAVVLLTALTSDTPA